MKVRLLFVVLLSLSFLIPAQSSARRKKRVFKRKWSISLVNGYNFANYPKGRGSANGPFEWKEPEGQMHPFFSALEISRNTGFYEMGAKIQHVGPTFVTPFFKWNWNKNNSRSSIIPSLMIGVVPYHLMGGWLRVNLGLSLNRYISIDPFLGVYAWYLLKKDDHPPKYEKRYKIHFNTGLRINMYY